jgi:hypothetical protein
MRRNPSVRKSKKRALKLLHQYWPHLSKTAERAERRAISRIFKGRGKTPRALRKSNPAGRARTSYFIGTLEFQDRGRAVAKAKEYANDSGDPVTVQPERYTPPRGGMFGGAGKVRYGKPFVVKPARKRNPPAGWIPVKAVKIERKGGVVKVRIRK